MQLSLLRFERSRSKLLLLLLLFVQIRYECGMIEFLATGFWTSNDISIRMKSGTAITQKPKLEATITFEHLN